MLAMNHRSRRRRCSFSSQGPSSSTYNGAVSCRKMALAAVVLRFDSVNRITVVA